MVNKEMLLLVVLPVLLGTIAITASGVLKRYVMKSGKISTLQFLILYYVSAVIVFVTSYVFIWGFTVADVLPGMWIAVLCGGVANTLIQFFNVKAASIDEGEVSLTAPFCRR